MAIAALGWAFTAAAARFPCDLQRPSAMQQDRLLWSYARLLAPDEEERINARLVAFARETSNQVLVVIVDTLCGMEDSDLAFELGERWGIGQKGFDNGIVFLIKPTGDAGDRRVFIATGYGLEGAIPDAVCRRIVDNEVLPRFRESYFADGINAALDVLFALAKGEYDHASYGRQRVPWGALLVVGGIFLFMGLMWYGRVRRYARLNNVAFWTAARLLGEMDQRHAGQWRGGSRPGGFGGFTGGGGGGGFGGFGGGSFGGGGAGGRW